MTECDEFGQYVSANPIARLEALVVEERERLAAFEVESSAEFARLRLDELRTSCALAGVAMTRDEIATLVERGIVVGSQPLAACILVADYAEAAAFVHASPRAGVRRRHITAPEIVALHSRALRRATGARPGELRRTTVPAFASGMVAPPAWLVPRDLAAFVERFGSGPPPGEPVLLWLAVAHERFLRIQPFASGNGRVARLVVDLLLRRVGLPPLIVGPRERARYVAALRAADARDHAPLATLIGRSSLAGLRRLHAAFDRRDRLEPLADLVASHERDALYKAAQRGRLRSVRRDGALLTTRANVEAYRASRAASGRRASTA